MLNVVVLIGRLVRDPELRHTAAGKAVASLRIAVDRGIGGGQEGQQGQQGQQNTDFIDVVVWEKQAEACAQYLTKGRLIAVQGRLQIRTYQANDGSNRTAPEVVANNVRFLESNRNAAAGGRGGGGNAPAPETNFGGDVTFGPDEDVPF